MPDQQDIERHAIHAQRAHQLQAALDKSNATIERLTRHVGALFDETALLKLELGGDVTMQVRAAAYRVVQDDLRAKCITGVNYEGAGEWRVLGDEPEFGPTCSTLMEAVDAPRGEL